MRWMGCILILVIFLGVILWVMRFVRLGDPVRWVGQGRRTPFGLLRYGRFRPRLPARVWVVDSYTFFWKLELIVHAHYALWV